MKKKLLMLAAMAGMCAVGMMSCRARSEFSAGKSLSPTEAQALLSSGEADAKDKEKEISADASVPEQEKMYYYIVGSGEVYHSNAACGYLKKSQSISTGTLAQVSEAGKTRLCAACAKTQAEAQPTPDQADGTATEESRTCYYTAGGKVWHYDRSCGTLVNSENVLSGTESQALLDGKMRPCARCGD